MNAPVVTHDRLKSASHIGPVDWRRIVQWLSDDKVISREEAQRTIARCSQAESSQHALVRLASVAMERASDSVWAAFSGWGDTLVTLPSTLMAGGKSPVMNRSLPLRPTISLSRSLMNFVA